MGRLARRDSGLPSSVDAAGRVRRWMPALDGLRGVAILVVVVHNVGYEQMPATTLMSAVYNLHAQGWFGVLLFFALSGFLITGILLDSDRSSVPAALRSFWVRRALRIFPLYYVTLFVGVFVLSRVTGGAFPFTDLNHQIWFWTYLCNWVEYRGLDIPAFSHFWSLAVEEQFYLLWPLVVLALSRRKLLGVCFALAAVALASRAALSSAGLDPLAIYQFTCTRMDALTLGAAAALVVREPRWLAWVRPRLGRAMGVTGVLVLSMVPFTHGFNRYDPWVQVFGYGLLAIFCVALVLFVAIEPESAVARWLGAQWLRWFGKYSYAIYVFHYPIARILSPRFLPSMNAPESGRALVALVAYAGIVLACSAIAAVLSWNLLERWALELKDRWAPRTAAHVGDGASSPGAIQNAADPVAARHLS